jgi:hypothetical protein
MVYADQSELFRALVKTVKARSGKAGKVFMCPLALVLLFVVVDCTKWPRRLVSLACQS